MVLGDEGELSLRVMHFVLYLVWGVLGSGLEKTYLSMRYSLSPRKESILNFRGSFYSFSLNLLRGSDCSW